MAGVNKVLLIGNLGADPEVHTFANGDKIVRINLATSEAYKNKDGVKVEDTEWHRVEFRGNMAEIVEQYTQKGDTIYVEGKIRSDRYTDNNGVERFFFKILASNLNLLPNGSRRAQREESLAREDSDLPF